MLGDDGLKRRLAPERARVFRAQRVEALLALALVPSFLLQTRADVSNACRERGHVLRGGIEGERDLAALAAAGGDVLLGGRDLAVQALCLAVEAGNAFFRLRHL